MSRSSTRSHFLTRLRQEPTTLVGLLLLILFALAALLAPVLSPYDPLSQNISESLYPPSLDHLLGTDKLGRDMFSRMLYGARISIVVGLVVVAMAGSLGAFVGLIAGYLGKWADE